MINFKLFRRRQRPARDLTTHASRIRIDPVDGEKGAAVRQDGPSFDVGAELTAYGDQMADVSRADGESRARSALLTAARSNIGADSARELLSRRLEPTTAALSIYDRAVADLLSFVRRAPHSRRRYETTRWVLLLGDTAGIWGAAIYMGELPLLAAGQAVAAGMAAITAGQVGADVRELRLARQRHDLAETERVSPEVQQRYPRMFGDPKSDGATYGLALKVALLVVLAIGLSVFALRATIEGAAGAVFGALALATAAASLINSWSYADDVADLLDNFRLSARQSLADHRQLAADSVISTRDAATAEAVSIDREYELRARSQSRHAVALTHEVYRRHPQVFGHGVSLAPHPTDVPSKVVPADSQRPGDRMLDGSNGCSRAQR